jgi:hypothetical protein
VYYEEKSINGIMMYRTHPHEEFVAYTIEQLSSRYCDKKKELVAANQLNSELSACMGTITNMARQYA